MSTRRLANPERELIGRWQRRSKLELAGLIGLTLASCGLGFWLTPHLDLEIATQLGGSPGAALAVLGLVGAFVSVTHGHGWWRQLGAVGLGYGFALTTLSSVAPGLQRPQVWVTSTIIFATVVLGISYLGRLFHRRINVVLKSHLIASDIERGVVERFVGEPRTRVLDSTLNASQRAEAFDPPDTTDQHVELLPNSGLVLLVNGHRPSGIELTHIVDVAPAQPHAFRSPLPAGLAPQTHANRVLLERRSLSPEERQELDRHIDRLRRPHWSIVAASFTSLILMLVQLQTLKSSIDLLRVPSLAWLGLVTITVVAYIRRRRAATRLEHDLQLRWVVTVVDGSTSESLAPKLEVLPVSQLAWNEGTAPAGWRVSRSI